MDRQHGSRRQGRRASKRPLSRTPVCELLEPRLLLSVDIAAPTLFSDLDGGADDTDGVANGMVIINDDLVIKDGGSINANDPASRSEQVQMRFR